VNVPPRAAMVAKTLTHPGDRIVALFPALLGFGGIQQAGRLTATTLAQIAAGHGWSTDFLSLNDSPGIHTFSCNGRSIPFSGFGRAKVRFVLSAMARARRQTSIVLAVHPHLAMVAAQMKLVQPKLKTVVISHGVEVWHQLPALRRKAFLKADLLLAPSSYTIEQLIRVQGAVRARTRLLSWPLDPDFLEMAAQRELLPLPSDFPRGIVLMAAARLSADERYKGVDQLIRAVSLLAPKFPSLYLVVVGSGDDLPRHQQLARDVGVADLVRFFPGLSQAEIAGCYSRCDVFALPSTGEGFGFVFLEAMAFGKPVVAASAGGVTDIVADEKSGLLVPPNDLGELVRALERLLGSEPLRVQLGRNGNDLVRSKFNFDAFRSQLEDVLWEGRT
jgi:phosphatidyl-myo-inositol dimannoside synthase